MSNFHSATQAMVKRWLHLPLMTMEGDGQKTWSVFSEFGMARVPNFPLSQSRQWEDMEGHSEMTYPRSVFTWGELGKSSRKRPSALYHGPMGGEGCHLLPGEGPSGVPTRKGSEQCISQRIRVRTSVTKKSLRLDYSQDCFCPLTSPDSDPE